MAGEPCSCDEALALRLENARLSGIIEGLREALWQGRREARGLCVSRSPDGRLTCELTAFHAGPHKGAGAEWSYG